MSELTREKIYKRELLKKGATGNDNLERIRSLKKGGEVVDNGEKIERLGNALSITMASATEVGGNIYIFGGRNGTNVYNRITKYNFETETFTDLQATLPYNLYDFSTASCGNKIYIFGGRKKVGPSDSANDGIFCFDTKTENLTTLEETGFYDSAVTVGGYIYLFYQIAPKSTEIRKFDVETGKTSSSVYFNHDSYYAKAESVGNNIYIFGNGDNTIYKYDTIAGTIEDLSIYLNVQKCATSVIGGNIYIFGGTGESGIEGKIYKFDTNNNALFELTIKCVELENMASAAVGNNIYLFGGDYGTNIGATNTQRFSVNF